MKKRIVATLTALVLSACMLVGCGEGEKPGNQGAINKRDDLETTTGEAEENVSDSVSEATDETAVTPRPDTETTTTTVDTVVSEEVNDADDSSYQEIIFDVSEIDEYVERYKDSGVKLYDKENSGNFVYKFANILSSDWKTPDLFVATSEKYINNNYPMQRKQERIFAVSTYHTRNCDQTNSEKKDNKYIFDFVFPISVTLGMKEDKSDYWADKFEVSYKVGGQQIFIKNEGYISAIGSNFETVSVYDIDYNTEANSRGSNSYNVKNLISMKKTADIDWVTKTYREVYSGVPSKYPGEDLAALYDAYYDYYTKNYDASFTSDDVYGTFDEAYEAYLKELAVSLYGANANVKIVHGGEAAEQIPSNVDDGILQKYKDFVGDDSFFYEYGCKFVDIDGDGTPELIGDYCAQFQRLLYLGSDGEIHEAYGFDGYMPNTGKLVFTGESGILNFATLTGGNIIDGFTIEVEWDWYEEAGEYIEAYKYYYKNGEEYYEITEEERNRILAENNYSDYTFAQCSDAPAEKTLEDAWRVYSVNIIDTVSTGGNDDIFQKYLNSVAADDISDDDGCCFVDIDGDGTPELIKHLGSRLPFLYYIDQNGNIDDAEITGLIEGSGKCVSEWSMGTGEESGIDFYTIREGMITKDCSVSRVYTEAGMGPVIYSYEHDGISEDITETQYEEFADRVKNYKLGDSYSSLSAAWEAYKH